MTLGGALSGGGGSGHTEVASGEDLGAGKKFDDETKEDFWATGVEEEIFAGVGFVAAVGLVAGIKPGGGDKVVGFGAGMNPTTVGKVEGLEGLE